MRRCELIFLMSLLFSSAPAAELKVRYSSSAYLAGETTVFDLSAPENFKADPTSLANDAVVAVKAEKKEGAWAWVILPLSTGTLHINLPYRSPDGISHVTGPLAINVRSPELPADADILDIKSPMRARRALWPWLLLLAAIVGGYYARRHWKVNPLANMLPTPIPRSSPEDEAAAALSDLQASGLWAKNPADFYFRLTEILRVYFERRYEQPFTTMTSHEIQRALKNRCSDFSIVASTREIFTRADMVKFARLAPGTNDGPQDADSALEVIRATTPQPVEREPAAP